MKTSTFLSLITAFLFMGSSGLAQELEITTTAANTVSSKSSVDLPGLTGNPLAIIIATPTGNTDLLNTNPIGVWYYSGKWNIFNSNHSVMPLGATYMIQFSLQPDVNHFMHLVTKDNTGAEGSYIDNPALNNNPGAQIKILQNYAPEVRSPYNLNRFKSKANYSTAAGRWYIANINGEPLYPNTVFNIVVSSAISTGVTPVVLATTPNTQNSPPVPAGTVAPAPIQVASPAGNTVNPIPFPDQTPRSASTPVPATIPSPVALPGTTPRPAPMQTPAPAATPPILNGWVDLHTHPMSHLGFGKKLLHGAPDIGMLIPKGTRNCNLSDFRATTINEALGSCSSTHGGWGLNTNPCGDHIRALVINRMFDKDFDGRLPGDPFNGGNLIGDHQHDGIDTAPFNFSHFPSQTSKVHQQMWWEWIKRAKEKGNLRVMVALTVNSELLANILNGDEPKDDKTSADLQLDELKIFIGRHPDFMEIAYTPADLRRIVGAGKLAVILGMEVDNIGNFNKPGAIVNQETVKAEIQRLYTKGVRYVFPIHLVNNKFGGTAVYEDLFNFSNKYSTGSFFTVSQSPAVNFSLGEQSELGVFLSTNKSIRPILEGLKMQPYPPAFNADPTSPDFCINPLLPFQAPLGCFRTFKLLMGIINPPSEYQNYATIPKGHINNVGLTGIGKFAVLEMMKLGMLIDIDHMSDLSQDDTLDIAERLNNNYPINIGHNGIQNFRSSERIASIDTVKRIVVLGGLFGVGTADSEEHHFDSQSFISSFSEVWTAMGGNSYGAVAIGTDVNGMERLPRAPSSVLPNFYNSDFPKSKTGNREWNYPSQGVAHYGLMADFLKDVKEKSPTVYENLMNSAEHFARMWEKAERQKTVVK